jgi:hypothetical protein
MNLKVRKKPQHPVFKPNIREMDLMGIIQKNKD